MNTAKRGSCCITYERTSHPSHIKNRLFIGLLPRRLKWSQEHWFKVFKADFGVKSTTKSNLWVASISMFFFLLCWMDERYARINIPIFIEYKLEVISFKLGGWSFIISTTSRYNYSLKWWDNVNHDISYLWEFKVMLEWHKYGLDNLQKESGWLVARVIHLLELVLSHNWSAHGHYMRMLCLHACNNATSHNNLFCSWISDWIMGKCMISIHNIGIGNLPILKWLCHQDIHG